MLLSEYKQLSVVGRWRCVARTCIVPTAWSDYSRIFVSVSTFQTRQSGGGGWEGGGQICNTILHEFCPKISLNLLSDCFNIFSSRLQWGITTVVKKFKRKLEWCREDTARREEISAEWRFSHLASSSTIQSHQSPNTVTIGRRDTLVTSGHKPTHMCRPRGDRSKDWEVGGGGVLHHDDLAIKVLHKHTPSRNASMFSWTNGPHQTPVKQMSI